MRKKMSQYYNIPELKLLGFKKIGKNILISKNSTYYSPESISFGDNTRVDDFCVLSGKIEIGDNCHISSHCRIASGISKIKIKNYSSLSMSCVIIAESSDFNGDFLGNPTFPRKYQKNEIKPVIIGEYCMIGTGTTIMPGVEMAEGSVVGAMSLLIRSTESWSVYFGIPARKISNRNNNVISMVSDYTGIVKK